MIKQEDLPVFGKLAHDFNPIHHDKEAAKAAGYPNCICYGMLVGSLFSGMLATDVPGPYTVYLQQNLRFTAPVFVGDKLSVSMEVLQFRASKGLIALKTTVEKPNPDGGKPIVCIDGTAVGLNKRVKFEGESEWTFK